ncbi:MAG: hypothetical protein K9K75_03890 [Deltaproteobacteria bacterium]|nr:hypothetical protein [Deltaproteobacteria bacterium]
MLKIVLWILVLYLLYRIVRPFIRVRKSKDKKNDAEDLQQCSHCGKYAPVSGGVKRKFAGKEYYFCSEKCKKQSLD